MAEKYGVYRTIPAWDIKDEDYFKKTMLESFETWARKNLDYAFLIREIEEMDLGLDNWVLPPDQHHTWSGTPWVNHLLSQREAIMVYGVSSPDPILSVRKLIFKRAGGNMIIGRNDLSELKTLEAAIKAVGECRDLHRLNEIFGESIFKMRMEGYFQEPYVCRPGESFGIGVIFLPGMEPKELNLMGYIAEAVGTTIAP